MIDTAPEIAILQQDLARLREEKDIETVDSTINQPQRLRRAKVNTATQLKDSSRRTTTEKTEKKDGETSLQLLAGSYFHKVLAHEMPRIFNGIDDPDRVWRTNHLLQPQGTVWEQIKKGSYIDPSSGRLIDGKTIVHNLTGQTYGVLHSLSRGIQTIIPEGYQAYYMPEFGMCRSLKLKENAMLLQGFLKQGVVKDEHIASYKVTGYVPYEVAHANISVDQLIRELEIYDKTGAWQYAAPFTPELGRAFSSVNSFAINTVVDYDEEVDYVHQPEAVLDGLIIVTKGDYGRERIVEYDDGRQRNRFDLSKEKNNKPVKRQLFFAMQNDEVQAICFEVKLHPQIHTAATPLTADEMALGIHWRTRIHPYYVADTAHQGHTFETYAASYFASSPVIRDAILPKVMKNTTFAVAHVNLPFIDRNNSNDSVRGARLTSSPTIIIDEEKYGDFESEIKKRPQNIASYTKDVF